MYFFRSKDFYQEQKSTRGNKEKIFGIFDANHSHQSAQNTVHKYYRTYYSILVSNRYNTLTQLVNSEPLGELEGFRLD